MGSEFNWSKRHYDLSMSKRTRKPLNLEEPATEIPIKTTSPKKDIPLKNGADEGDRVSSPTSEIPIKTTSPKKLDIIPLKGDADKGDEESTPTADIPIKTTSPKKDIPLKGGVDKGTPTAEIPIKTTSPKKDIPLKGGVDKGTPTAEIPIKMTSPKKDTPLKGSVNKGDEETTPTGINGGDKKGRKSLKQLINGSWGANKVTRAGSEANKGRNSLGQHFTEEEKQLQLVIKPQEEGINSKGTMSRYIKVLSHLIKAKRDLRLGSRKKAVLRITM